MPVPEHILPKSLVDLTIKITAADGTEQEFKTEINKIEIIEGIHHHILHGSVEMFDVIGIREFFPITGEEVMVISYVKDKLTVEHTFNIVAVEDIGDIGGAHGFKFRFTSPETVANHLKYISRSYKGRITDIISEIYSSCFEIDIDNIEHSNGIVSYIAPNIRPFDAIKTLLNDANDRQFWPMAFYKTCNSNEYNLVSYYTLFNQDPILTYNADPIKIIDNEPLQSLGKEQNLNKIIRLSKDKFCDTEELLHYGVPTARAHHYDLIDKTYQVAYHEYKGDRLEKDYTTQFGRPLNFCSNRLSFNNESIQNLVGTDPYSKMNMKAFFNERDTVVLSGELNSNKDLNVGSVITLEIDSVLAMIDEKTLRDQTLSGNYLINRLRHVLDKTKGYTIEGQFIKNKVM